MRESERRMFGNGKEGEGETEMGSRMNEEKRQKKNESPW